MILMAELRMMTRHPHWIGSPLLQTIQIVLLLQKWMMLLRLVLERLS